MVFEAWKSCKSGAHKYQCLSVLGMEIAVSSLCRIEFIDGFKMFGNLFTPCLNNGAWGSVVVKAVRYKSEGPGIDSKRWHFQFILWQLTFPCALGSIQPLKNEYQDIHGGKGGRCVRVTTLPTSCAECLVIWSLNRPEPSGSHRPVIGIALPFLPYCLNNTCQAHTKYTAYPWWRLIFYCCCSENHTKNNF